MSIRYEEAGLGGLKKVAAAMDERDARTIIGALFAYTGALIIPHITHFLFLQEMLSAFFALVVLASLYNVYNLSLIIASVFGNLVFSYVPIKEKSTKTKLSIFGNLAFVLFCYLVYDRKDNAPFAVLCPLFMKYVYLSAEYSPKTNGAGRYFGYVFFIPGLRYGPVMSYKEYEKYVSLGYHYALEGIDEEIVKKAVGEEENSEQIEYIKGEVILRQYYWMFAVSAAKFFASLVYFGVHRLFRQKIRAFVAPLPFIWTLPLVELLSFADKYLVVARWWSEEAMFLSCFVNGMSNVSVKRLETSTDLSEMYNSWNLHGSRFVHEIGSVLLQDAKKEEEPEALDKKSKKNNALPKKAEKSFSFSKTLLSLFISFGHFLLFPPSVLSLLLCSPLILCSAFFPDRAAGSPGRCRAIFRHLLSRTLFACTVGTFYRDFESFSEVLYHMCASIPILSGAYLTREQPKPKKASKPASAKEKR